MADNIIKVPINFDKKIAEAYKAELEALRAKLAECEAIKQRAIENKSIETEAHWKTQKELEAVKAKLAEVERERDNIHKHRSIIWMDLERVRVERDEARRWASAWKRSAKMWRSVAFMLAWIFADERGEKLSRAFLWLNVRHKEVTGKLSLDFGFWEEDDD